MLYTNFSVNKNFNASFDDFEDDSPPAYTVPDGWTLTGFWPKSRINWNKEGFRTGVVDRAFPAFVDRIGKEIRSGKTKGDGFDAFRSMDDAFFGEELLFSRPFSEIDQLADDKLKRLKTWKSGFIGRRFQPTLIPSNDGYGLLGFRKGVKEDGTEHLEGYFYPGFMSNMSPEWRSHIESVYGKDYVASIERAFAEDIAKTYSQRRNQVPFSPNVPKIEPLLQQRVYETFERRNGSNQKFLDRQKAIDELKDNPNLVYNPEWRKRADYVLSDEESYDELFSNEDAYEDAMFMGGNKDAWDKFSNSVLDSRQKNKKTEIASKQTTDNEQEVKPLKTNFPIPSHKTTVDNASVFPNSDTGSRSGSENVNAEIKNVAVNNSLTTNFPKKVFTTNFSKSKKDKEKRLEELLMERSVGEIGEGYGSENPYLADVLAVGVAPAIANKIVSTKKNLSKYDKLAENDAIVSQSAKSAGLLGLIGAGVGAVGGGLVGWNYNPNINDALFGAQIGAMGVGGLGALLGGVHGALKGKDIAKRRRNEERRLILKALEE